MALLRGEDHLRGDSPEIRALDAIVQRCLAKDPRDRCGSAAELAHDLVPALARSETLGARVEDPGGSAADGSTLMTRPDGG